MDAWLWRIVVNEAKRVRREPLHQPLDEFPEEAANGNGSRDELGVRALLAELPDRQKQVLYLRYYAQLGYREIAEILEVEVGTVSATLSAAHTRLRKTLRKVER